MFYLTLKTLRPHLESVKKSTSIKSAVTEGENIALTSGLNNNNEMSIEKINAPENRLSTAKIIYLLLIISTLFGFTGIIALIMAYVIKDDSTHWLQTHYRFQIRTYWIGLLYVAIGVVFLNTLFAYVMFIFTFVWIIVRCSKGLKQLEAKQPVKNMESWFFT